MHAKSAARQGELGGEGHAAVKWDKPVDLQPFPYDAAATTACKMNTVFAAGLCLYCGC